MMEVSEEYVGVGGATPSKDIDDGAPIVVDPPRKLAGLRNDVGYEQNGGNMIDDVLQPYEAQDEQPPTNAANQTAAQASAAPAGAGGAAPKRRRSSSIKKANKEFARVAKHAFMDFHKFLHGLDRPHRRFSNEPRASEQFHAELVEQVLKHHGLNEVVSRASVGEAPVSENEEAGRKSMPISEAELADRVLKQQGLPSVEELAPHMAAQDATKVAGKAIAEEDPVQAAAVSDRGLTLPPPLTEQEQADRGESSPLASPEALAVVTENVAEFLGNPAMASIAHNLVSDDDDDDDMHAAPEEPRTPTSPRSEADEEDMLEEKPEIAARFSDEPEEAPRLSGEAKVAAVAAASAGAAAALTRASSAVEEEKAEKERESPQEQEPEADLKDRALALPAKESHEQELEPHTEEDHTFYEQPEPSARHLNKALSNTNQDFALAPDAVEDHEAGVSSDEVESHDQPEPSTRSLNKALSNTNQDFALAPDAKEDYEADVSSDKVEPDAEQETAKDQEKGDEREADYTETEKTKLQNAVNTWQETVDESSKKKGNKISRGLKKIKDKFSRSSKQSKHAEEAAPSSPQAEAASSSPQKGSRWSFKSKSKGGETPAAA